MRRTTIRSSSEGCPGAPVRQTSRARGPLAFPHGKTMAEEIEAPGVTIEEVRAQQARREEARGSQTAETRVGKAAGKIKILEKAISDLLAIVETIAVKRAFERTNDEEQKACFEIARGFEEARQAWIEVAGALSVALEDGPSAKSVALAHEKALECQRRSEAWGRKAAAQNSQTTIRPQG